MSEGAFGPAVGCRSGGAQTRGGGGSFCLQGWRTRALRRGTSIMTVEAALAAGLGGL